MKFSIKKYLKWFSYGPHLNPARDWMLLLSIGAVLIAGSVAWNVWLFYQSLTGKQIGASQATTTPTNTLPPDAVTNVQDVFKKRATEESNYQKSYRFVDPSVLGS